MPFSRASASRPRSPRTRRAPFRGRMTGNSLHRARPLVYGGYATGMRNRPAAAIAKVPPTRARSSAPLPALRSAPAPPPPPPPKPPKPAVTCRACFHRKASDRRKPPSETRPARSALEDGRACDSPPVDALDVVRMVLPDLGSFSAPLGAAWRWALRRSGSLAPGEDPGSTAR